MVSFAEIANHRDRTQLPAVVIPESEQTFQQDAIVNFMMSKVYSFREPEVYPKLSEKIFAKVDFI